MTRHAGLRAMTQHVYPPHTVAAMTGAWNRLCESISISGGDLRRQLALIILRHVDRGVQDPEQLSEMAFHEFAGRGASASERSATGRASA
jgi:hypothetical protein